MLIFFIPLFILLAYFYPTIAQIGHICWTDDNYSHGLLLPFISAYIIRERFKEGISNNKSYVSKLIVVPLILIGIATAFISSVGSSLFGNWVSLFILLIGTIALTLPKAVFNAVAGSTLLMFLAKPIPDSLTVKLFNPLQAIGAKAIAYTLELLNVPVYRTGNIIEIPGLQLMVEEACSGMRSVITMISIAFAVCLYYRLTKIKSIFLLVCSVAVAVLLNVFRVVLTGLLSHYYDKKAAEGLFHTSTGMVTFLIGLIILMKIGDWIQGKGFSPQILDKAVRWLPFNQDAKGQQLYLASSYAGFLALTLFGGNYFVNQSPTIEFHKLELSSFPEKLGDWDLTVAGNLDNYALNILKLDQSLKRTYKNAAGDKVDLYIGYWHQQDGDHQAAKHSPAICLPSNGWTVWDVERKDLGDLAVKKLSGQFKNHDRAQFYYWFFAGGETYLDESTAIFKILSKKLFEGRSDGGIVEISISVPTTGSIDEKNFAILDSFTKEVNNWLSAQFKIEHTNIN